MQQRTVLHRGVLSDHGIGDRRLQAGGALPLLGRTHLAVAADLVDAPVDLQVMPVGVLELDGKLVRRRGGDPRGGSPRRGGGGVRARSTSSSVETSNAIWWNAPCGGWPSGSLNSATPWWSAAQRRNTVPPGIMALS